MSLAEKFREYKLPLLTGLAFVAVLVVGRTISSKYAQLLAIVLLFLTIWFTLDRRPREGISPYALQNPNFEKMSGQLTAEDFDAAIRGGGIAPIRNASMPIARKIDGHQQEGSTGSRSSMAFSGIGYRLSSAALGAGHGDDGTEPPQPPADAAARAAAAARARAAAAAAARAAAAGDEPFAAAAAVAAIASPVPVIDASHDDSASAVHHEKSL